MYIRMFCVTFCYLIKDAVLKFSLFIAISVWNLQLQLFVELSDLMISAGT